MYEVRNVEKSRKFRVHTYKQQSVFWVKFRFSILLTRVKESAFKLHFALEQSECHTQSVL